MCANALFLTSLSVFSIVVAASAQESERPNVIVIISDDQGWADIGYHNPKVYSPRLDALAAAAVVVLVMLIVSRPTSLP